jgi:ABC-type phosphate transport system substrate-binding protein
MRLAVLLLGTFLIAPASGSNEVTLTVIVNLQRSESLTREDLVQIYMKQRRFWRDNAPIIALNREPGSPERERFSRLVLGKGSAALAAYWNQQYFHGILPPISLSSGEAIKRYVASDRDAIGYIAADEVDDSVRVVLRLP